MRNIEQLEKVYFRIMRMFLKECIFLIYYNQNRYSMMSTRREKTQINNLSSLLIKTKSPQRIENYEQKLETAMELNSKLKELMETMRSNVLVRKIEMNKTNNNLGDDQQILKLRKKESKLTSQLQQLTNNLNVLVSENAKLKSQVDISRNSRVIYSNVYKTIEKEIRKHQYLYKQTIIDYLSYEEVDKKVTDKMAKTIKKIEKEISQLQGNSKVMRKKDKRKSRLDTGLSSYRLESKDTCRCSNEEGKLTARQDQNRSSLQQLIEVYKKDATKRSSNEHPQNINQSVKKDERVEKTAKTQKTEKTMRSRARMVTQKVNDYYQLQMKSNYYDNIMKHLREITGLEQINLIISEWQVLDSRIQNEYNEYINMEKQLKALREEKGLLETQMDKKSEKEIQTAKSIEEEELALVQAELQKQKERLGELQGKLTVLIDINTSKLSNQEIRQHIERIKRRGDSTARELERLLQGVTKQKKQNIGVSRISNKSQV